MRRMKIRLLSHIHSFGGRVKRNDSILTNKSDLAIPSHWYLISGQFIMEKVNRSKVEVY